MSQSLLSIGALSGPHGNQSNQILAPPIGVGTPRRNTRSIIPARPRRGPDEVIRIERVDVNDGAQTIVGEVKTGSQ